MGATQRGPARDRTPLEIVLGQNNSANSELQTRQQEPNKLPDTWTYVRLENIGRMYSGPEGFGAFSGTGTYIGTFASTTAARSAIWEHHVGEQSGFERMAA
jgi:hypothetical protein